METVRPPCAREMPKVFVSKGMIPTLINSVDPMAKALIASDKRIHVDDTFLFIISDPYS